MALHKPQIYVFTYIPGDRKLRIIYFLVKLRIIFHSTYENGQYGRKTAFYTRTFPGNRHFKAGKGNRKWLFSTRNSGFPCSRIPDGQARKEGERGMRTEAHKPPEMLQQAGPGIRSAFFMATPRRL